MIHQWDGAGPAEPATGAYEGSESARCQYQCGQISRDGED
jgi:hypothetical protein